FRWRRHRTALISILSQSRDRSPPRRRVRPSHNAIFQRLTRRRIGPTRTRDGPKVESLLLLLTPSLGRCDKAGHDQIGDRRLSRARHRRDTNAVDQLRPLMTIVTPFWSLSADAPTVAPCETEHPPPLSRPAAMRIPVCPIEDAAGSWQRRICPEWTPPIRT